MQSSGAIVAGRVDSRETEGRVNVGNNSGSRNRGFSLLEMVAVIAIIMTVTAVCVTTINTAIRTGHIRRSANRYVELLQTARTRAAADDRYYSVYILPAAGAVPQRAYVDIYPQQANGASGHGAPPAGFYEAGPPSDPVVTISNDVAVQPVGAAPNTADLKNRFCANCATAIIFNQWPTWGPDGMPCQSQLSSDGSTTVCNSAGGPRAYWTFFQSQATSEWAAVTITPAGRVRGWTYGANSGTWAPQ